MFSSTFSLASLAVVLEVVLSLQTEKRSYAEYSVLRAYTASQEDLDLLHSIGNTSPPESSQSRYNIKSIGAS